MRVTTEAISAVKLLGETSFEVLTATGQLQYTRDGGATWTTLSPGFTPNNIAYSNEPDTKGLYAVGTNGGAVQYGFSDDWVYGSAVQISGLSALTSENFTDIFVGYDTGNFAIAITASGKIYEAGDFTSGNLASAIWSPILQGVPYSLEGIGVVDRGNGGLFVVGDNGLIMKTK